MLLYSTTLLDSPTGKIMEFFSLAYSHLSNIDSEDTFVTKINKFSYDDRETLLNTDFYAN